MSPTEEDVRANVVRVLDAVARAATRAGRDPAGVTLVAAAKGVPAHLVGAAVEAGVTAVGENYVQELRAVREALGDVGVRWHYIGALRSSTAHHVADLSDVVETLGGERAIRRLAGRAARAARRLDALIEVDFTGARAGVGPDQLPSTADLAASLEGLRLRGLMTIPPPTPTPEGARAWFRRLRDLRDRLARTHPGVVDLSMGMSLDYEVAVEEGATMVRVGTALFGPRTT
ncbi:MAG TPA: YggS family pyridoxal phosphate-dependent enzyme [Actinomycetota bacterium]